MRPLLLLLLLTACAPKAVPPDTMPTVAAFAIDRSTLPGGEFEVLHVADSSSPARMVYEGGGKGVMTLPVHVYAYEHPTEGLVLIDAGYGRRTSISTDDYPGRRLTKLLGVSMEAGAAAVDQLGERAGSVKHIVLTHMHPDHVAGVEDFGTATLHVGPGEWEAAYEGGILGKPDVSPFDGREGVHHVAFDAGAYGPFEASHDLFGDGSIVLMQAGGHTPGHMAVMVNLPERSILLTGDCAWINKHYEGPTPKVGLVRGLLEDDWRLNWANQWRIHVFAKANPDVVVIGGHEPRTMELLGR